MISVIITAKNAARTIAIAVRSTLIGLGPGDEILVLLDGCTDDTATKVSKISDPRLRIFSVPESLGRSQGRNFLISKAKGELIAILDADDISLPWRFLRSKQLLKKHDAVFSAALVFGLALKPIPLIPQVPRRIASQDMAIECLGRNPLVHSSAMFKSDVIKAIGNYRDSEAEEYDLWLRMINAGYRLHRVALPWVLYRFHKNQASQSPGFVDRGLNCRFVQSEQMNLAESLGITAKNVQGVREEALRLVKNKGLFARLELAGLSNLKSLFQ